MKLTLSTIAVSLFALVGCSSPQRGSYIVANGTDIGICSRHRASLLTVSGFRLRTAPHMYFDPDVELEERIERHYPNAIPWFAWLSGQLGQEVRGEPTLIRYCPICERGAQRIRP